MSDLLHHLDALCQRTDATARVATDPVAFVHRYPNPADAEVAGLYAAGLAYGRVDLFRPVLQAWFDHLDTLGGPRAAVDAWAPGRHVPAHPLIYRWNRGVDLDLLTGALHLALGPHPVSALFHTPGPMAQRLGHAVSTLRAAMIEAARQLGLPATTDADLPRGARYLLPHPRSGSACKRLNLYLRWMVRPADGVDLGLWTHIRPAELVIPLDVHVGRVSRFLGLTTRQDASWRTACEVTDALRRLDPADPVRFDFALAHLGISDACLGTRHAEVCPACPLDAVCRA